MSIRTMAVLLFLAGAAVLILRADPISAGESVWSRSQRPGVERTPTYNFPPETYALMEERTRGTVAVARGPAGGRIGTGILVGRGLVLTCRHLTHDGGGNGRRRAARALEVHLEVADATGTPTYRRFPVLEYVHTSDRIDLCILRIGPDEKGRLPEPERAQQLSLDRVRPDDPLYVVHHPRGERLQVADGGRALFPFCVTEDELAGLVARARAATSTVNGDRVSGEILRSYRSTDGRVFCNYSRRWAGQPVLGADCLTMDGSSGAPVYSKHTHELVGMVFAGVDQSRRSFPSYWEHHEAILPAAAILDDLARSPRPELRRMAAEAGVRAPAEGR